MRQLALSALLALTLWLPGAVAARELTEAEGEIVTQAFTLSLEARELYYAGRFAEAEATYRKVYALNSQLSENELSLASTLHNIAAAVAGQGRLLEAEEDARRALQLRIDHGGVDFVVISSSALLATILGDLNEYTEARILMQEAVELTLSSSDADQSELIKHVTVLAYYTAQDGYVQEGIAILNQIVPMLADIPQTDGVRLLNALGRLSSLNGQPQQAETYYREALNRQTAFDPSPDWSTRDMATVLGNLASILRDQGRIAEAQALFLQADAMLVKAGVLATETRATILDGLGETLRATGDLHFAFDVQRQSLSIRQAVFPAGHLKTGISFSNLGLTLLQGGQLTEATQALEKAVAIQRQNGDANRFSKAALNLSAAHAATGDFDTATALAAEAQSALAAILPPDHPDLTKATFNRAWLHLGAGENDIAADLADQGMQAFLANRWQMGAENTTGVSELRDTRRQVLASVVANWETNREAGMDAAFQAAQWAQASKAAHVAQRVAARFASGDGALAELARAKQNLVNRWRATDAHYLALLAKAPPGDPRIATLKTQMATLSAQIAEADAALARDYPEFAQLTQPQTVSVSQIQAGLAPGEAFLMPITTPDETYVFAITSDTATWAKSAMAEREMVTQIRQLRADLDPNGPARGAVALDDNFAADGAPAFDGDAAYALYQALVAPVADDLAAAETVYVVKEGPVSGVPLAVLLETPTDLYDATVEEFQAAPWLIRRYGFSTVPSAAAFLAQRGSEPARAATVTLAGFADPDFQGNDEAETPSMAALFTRNGAVAENVRGLARLPGTRREVVGLAKALDTPVDQLALGTDATEAAVKSSAALRDARIAVFATHGLVAGELSGLSEPALAFTAPDQPDAEDDGLLTASEASRLDLVADWVVLSACNTAASDGTPGGEGLSGLASAFLFAGAQSLLVSHWPVRDDAAAQLTVEALTAHAETPDIAKAQNLRRAMLSMIDNGDIPDHAHPSVWAPFVVVGSD
ncbi:CHAT domain-containing tetratricopeptide repeat protein [Shimia abyssi]|uniref:CHAT domain-containing protein n=1 Tax=Shimia abyssi TaxID=1662395 RepID=A0A2P8FBU6_9RHOB|nr:CHAT domain-containing tetratricopeptide repeat protein [Shimia abyssi]PSL19196.1 CHAT domain-containing protein [Shimia abyssi]